MKTGLVEVRALLGDTPHIDDREIEETLWYYYFDVPRTVRWLSSLCYVILKLTGDKYTPSKSSPSESPESKSDSISTGKSMSL
jgi:hypothetical protein